MDKYVTDEQCERTERIDAGSHADLASAARTIQMALDGVRGTKTDSLEYLRLLQLLAD